MAGPDQQPPRREYLSRTSVPEYRRVFDGVQELLETGCFESPTKTGARKRRIEESLEDIRGVMRYEVSQMPPQPANTPSGAARQAIEDVLRNPRIAKKIAGMARRP